MRAGVFRRGLGDVMVNDHPFRFVHARFKGEIRDPRGLFAQIALFPIIIMIRLQRNRLVEYFFGQLLQQQAGDQTIQIAFVGENDFRFGQQHHAAILRGFAPRGERGFPKSAGASSFLVLTRSRRAIISLLRDDKFASQNHRDENATRCRPAGRTGWKSASA